MAFNILNANDLVFMYTNVHFGYREYKDLASFATYTFQVYKNKIQQKINKGVLNWKEF